MSTLDTLDVGIIWSRLVSTVDEMVSALVRTSFSTMVRESGDFSCMLFDGRGKFLAQGTLSVPSFTGTGPATLAGVLETIPIDSLRDGDILMTNDPWIGTGHVYDVNIIKPIFMDGRLVAFALSVSHLADVGGIGYGTGARDVYEEGIVIPPVKLFDQGKANDFVFKLIETNVRFRDLVIGDIYSNVAACNVAATGVLDLLAEYKLTDLVEAAEGIFALTRSSINEVLKEIPAGRYDSRLPVEGIEQGDTFDLAVAVTISNSGFAFDFEGTAPVINRGINVPLCYTRAYCNFCFKTIVAPSIPNNQAILDFVSLSAPDNCILNAKKPYPTGGRHILGHYVAPLVFGALSAAIPAHVQADSGMIFQINFRGRSPSGRDFSYIFFTAGGYGAFADQDGRAALPGPSNMIAIPIEIWEENTGITYLRKELRPNSGGIGEFQGGTGQIIEVRNDTGRTIDAAFFGSRTDLAARGFRGGHNGSLRLLFVNGETVPPKLRTDLSPGAVVSLHEAGGGGFGDPALRAKARVLADLKADLITPDHARVHYADQVQQLTDKEGT